MKGKHTQATKDKISAKLKGRSLDVLHKINCTCCACKAKRGELKHSEHCMCCCCKAKNGMTKGKNHPLYGRKGKDSPIFGQKRTIEQRKRMSDSQKGRNKGKTYEEIYGKETAQRMKKARSKSASDETRKKMSLVKKGKTLEELGHKTETCSCPFCKVKRGELSGKNNPMKNPKTARKKAISMIDWVFYTEFGTFRSQYPYPETFDKKLKQHVAKRDNFTCQICNLIKPEKWSIHHIDYDKENCNLSNLAYLCKSCHSKTNFNREYWKNYFKNKTELESLQVIVCEK